MSKTMMIAVAVVAFVIMVVALIYLLKTSQDVKAARATNRYAGVDGGRSHAGKYARLVLLAVVVVVTAFVAIACGLLGISQTG